jgi:uncharacterized protein (TIGR00299 family) protein
MFLGALVDAGVPLAVMQEATAALKLGASLRVETVDRSGISSTKVHVMEGDRLAEDVGSFEHQRAHTHSHETHSHQPKTQHLHKTGHAHDHPHEEAHAHGRSLTVIRGLIEGAALGAEVKRTAIRAFELLGASEAKIHNVPVEEIHFHEVGAVDAIVDIVAASAGIHHLKIGAWVSSAVNVGGGMVQCAHGLFPVPAPATADLLRGVPTYSAHVEKELVTPTGAALLRAIEPTFGGQPAMRVEVIGYGAGTRNPKDFPNVLRLTVGETDGEPDGGDELETVTVLETALDDLSPQVIAYVAEAALAAGALDVMLTPVVMKKGRPGTLVTVLCEPAKSEELQRLLLRETSTLGVRVRQDKRVCLERRHVAVATEFGEIRVKIGMLGGEEMNAAAEFGDCKAAALKHGVALKKVQAEAVAAYRSLGR